MIKPRSKGAMTSAHAVCKSKRQPDQTTAVATITLTIDPHARCLTSAATIAMSKKAKVDEQPDMSHGTAIAAVKAGDSAMLLDGHGDIMSPTS